MPGKKLNIRDIERLENTSSVVGVGAASPEEFEHCPGGSTLCFLGAATVVSDE